MFELPHSLKLGDARHVGGLCQERLQVRAVDEPLNKRMF